MKKFILISLLSFLCITTLMPTQAMALCDDSGGGLVPCGNTLTYGPDGKTATGVVCPCEFGHFFVLLAKVYNFIVKYLVTSLAVIMITVGAIFMMISAGSPNLAGTGRNMVKYAIIGLILVFGSWIIVDTFLKILGYQGQWFIF